MRKWYLLLALPFVLAGCSKEDDPILEETYLLTSFDFYLDEGDGIEVLKEVHDFPVIKNHTDQIVTVEVPFVDRKKLQETSCFYFDGELFDYVVSRDGVDKPRLPEYINENGDIWYSSDRGTFVPGEIEYFPYNPLTDIITRTGTVGPNCMLQVADTVIYRQITVSYKMRFEIIPSQEILELTGKWEGKYVDHVSGCVIHSEMKE